MKTGQTGHNAIRTAIYVKFVSTPVQKYNRQEKERFVYFAKAKINSTHSINTKYIPTSRISSPCHNNYKFNRINVITLCHKRKVRHFLKTNFYHYRRFCFTFADTGLNYGMAIELHHGMAI